MARGSGRHGGGWTEEEARILEPLSSPGLVQDFLDAVPYSSDHFYRSPRSVMRDRKAHCFDGALFAAAALRFHGHAPLLLDLRAENDDDHVLAVFRRGRGLGAVAKSNFVGIRFREPIHRTLRELALSFFEAYYNTLGEKTLRAYSALLDLSGFDRQGWETRDEALDGVAARLDSIRHYPLLDSADVRALRPVDRRSLEAGLLGSNAAGLYKPALDGR
jgi:hypothetical protein